MSLTSSAPTIFSARIVYFHLDGTLCVFFFLYISPLPEVYRIFLDFLNGDIYDSVLLGAWARIQIQIKKISKESKFRIAFFFLGYTVNCLSDKF